MLSKHQHSVFPAMKAVFVLTLLYWFGHRLVTGEVPETMVQAVGFWRFSLPYPISAWWQVLTLPFAVGYLLSLFFESKEGGVFGALIGAGLGFVMTMAVPWFACLALFTFFGVLSATLDNYLNDRKEVDYGLGVGLGIGLSWGAGLFAAISVGRADGAGFNTLALLTVGSAVSSIVATATVVLCGLIQRISWDLFDPANLHK